MVIIMNLITKFNSDLQNLFGNRIIDIILYGSFVRGDFNPNSSDVDFLVFIEGKLSKKDIQRLRTLHEQYRECDTLMRLLEGRYIGIVNIEMVNGYYLGTSKSGWKELFTLGFDPIESGMILDKYVSYNNHTIINQFLTLDWSTIKKQIKIQYDDLVNHKLFLEDKGYTNYALITCARSLYTYTRLGFISKVEAISWIQEMGVYFSLEHPKKTAAELQQVFRLQENYQIVDLDNIDLFELSCLLTNLNAGMNQVRYFPKTVTEVYQRVTERQIQSNRDLKVVMLQEEIVGFIDVFVEEDKHYLQVSSIFSNGFMTYTWYCVFEYLRKTYKEYKLHIVLSDVNQYHINYMKSINANTDGFESMLHITKEWFNDTYQTNNVNKLESHQYDKFIELHDSVYPDVYWNGSELIKSNKFEIFSYNDVTCGYSVITKMNRAEEEVYFLYGNEDKVKRNMIIHTLKNAFKSCKSVILLLDKNEISNIDFFLDIGFKVKETIIMFEIEKM